MPEPSIPGGVPDVTPAPVCPWCSALLPAPEPERCPSCLATLHEPEAAEVPGVTRIDHEALLRRRPAERSRETTSLPSAASLPPASRGAVAPPPEDVRREMLRLEAAALEIEIQARLAEADALASAAGEELPGSGAELPESGEELPGAAEELPEG